MYRRVSAINRKLSWFKSGDRSESGLFLKGYRNGNDFDKETKTALSEVEHLTKLAVNSNNDNVVENIDNLSNRLCLTADLADCVRALHGDPQIAEAADECNQTMGGVVETLNATYELQKPLEVFCSSPEFGTYPKDKQRCAKLLLHDFQQSGTLLPSDDRENYIQVHRNILHNQALLQQKSYEPSVYHSSAISSELKQALVSSRYVEIINHQGEEYIAQYYWLTNHPDENLRSHSYLMYHDLVAAGEAVQALVSNRQKMANILGFESYAHRALMLAAPKSVSEVDYFLKTLSKQYRPYVENEKQLLGKQLGKSTSEVWDLQMGKERFSGRPNLSRYLNLFDVIDGFSKISDSLFNVRLERADTVAGETWHKDVVKYKVIHSNDGDQGTLYIDPFGRGDKRASDCQFTVQCGKKLEHSYQNPIIVVSFSINPNSNNQITFNELKTIFHEMGHAMHSFLGRSTYQHLFGTRISTDFAEVPSTLFEYFASDRRILNFIGRDFATGEKLNLSLDEEKALNRNSKTHALDKQYAVYQSIIDLELHSNGNLNDVNDLVARMTSEYGVHDSDAHSKWWTRFSHFSMYGAKYYSYLYAQAIAGRLWEKLFLSDPLNPAAGDILKECFLKHGNGREPADMYKDMLQEELDPDSLIDSLMTEFKTGI